MQPDRGDPAVGADMQARRKGIEMQPVQAHGGVDRVFQRGAMDHGPRRLGKRAGRDRPLQQPPQLIAHDAAQRADQRRVLPLCHARAGRGQQRRRNASAAQQRVDVVAKAVRTLQDAVHVLDRDRVACRGHGSRGCHGALGLRRAGQARGAAGHRTLRQGAGDVQLARYWRAQRWQDSGVHGSPRQVDAPARTFPVFAPPYQAPAAPHNRDLPKPAFRLNDSANHFGPSGHCPRTAASRTLRLIQQNRPASAASTGRAGARRPARCGKTKGDNRCRQIVVVRSFAMH
ncbi:hypothetical protein D3C72_1342680 [compost metagenome]